MTEEARRAAKRKRAAERQRVSRARQEAGLRVLRVVVDEEALKKVLVKTGQLHPLSADDPAALVRAVEGHLANLRVAELEP
jgi:hypothetical protein